MAELYSRPVSYVDIGNQSNKTNFTGNQEIDSVIESLPEEEKQKALEQYNAPLTGEEVAQALMMSPTFVPTVKEYKAYKEYQATKSTDIFDSIANAAGYVVDDLARGFQGAGKDPSKIPASLVEAFAQGTRNLYGMIAQSQDPDSILFKWKDALSNSYSDEGYRQFLEARDFNRESIDLLEGKSTVLVNKDLVNHDVVQAASYIADPTLFIPFGEVASAGVRALGMGERLAVVTARASAIKNMIYAGTLKYGAGIPLEFIGNATRRVIDKGISASSSVFETATGISAKDTANYVKTAGFGTSVSGIAGHPVPYASSISNAYLNASVVSGLGESLTAVADQMLKNQGRKGYMSFAEAAIRQSDDMLAKGGHGLSPHARKLLNVIDKADPMFAYTMEGLEGAAMGSAIGGGLGYLSGGEEGFAGGIGSGAVLGGVGGVAGRVVSDVAGASLKAERKVQADLVLEIMKDADPAKFTELSRLRAIAEANGDNIDGYIAGIDLVSPNSKWASGDSISHEAFLESKGQDPKTFDGFEQDNTQVTETKPNEIVESKLNTEQKSTEKGKQALPEPTDKIWQETYKAELKSDTVTGVRIEGKEVKVSELDINTTKLLIENEEKKVKAFVSQGDAVEQLAYATTLANMRKLKARLNELKGIKVETSVKPTVEQIKPTRTEQKNGIRYKLDDKGNQVRLLDADGFEVPTMEQFNRGAGWTMTRNADNAVKVHINTTKYNPNTVPHELFHAIFREEAMKPEFKNRLARAILGTFDENGKMVAQPSINKAESRAFFENYIKAENKGNAGTIADNLSLLDKALTEYYKDGTMSVMSEDGKTPYLVKLTEEFGAYYFTQFIQGKRPDFLFRGGKYSGMRGLIETVKTGWLDYMERKITSVNPTFDFNRPDQTINPAFKDANGNRIRVSALDHLMTDIVKASSQTNRNGSFDFRTLSPEGQEAYVKANGLSRIYRKRANGKYERMNKPEQAAYDKARGIEIFKAINGLPPEALRATDANGVVTHELIAVRDAKGNILHYEGTMSPAVLDHLQRTGYLDAPEKLRIQQLQDIVAGRTKSNIIEFIYHGREEGIAEGADIRVSGDAVSVKSRVALVLAMNNKIKANGEHSFTALTLDWRNIKMRGEKLWADPAVRKMWNNDQSAFQGDFFRYLENASLPEGKRIPSAQLWQVDGEKKRNIMHQFAGMQRTGVINGKGGSYFNAPNAEIVNDVTASITNFRTEGMGKITLTNDIVKFNPEGIKPIQMNFMPSEMNNENTPNGNIRITKDGYKFIEDETGVKVYKPNGDFIGKYSTAEEAQAKALEVFKKENPAGKPIPSVDNIRQEPLDAPETQAQYANRKIDSFYERPENALDLINSEEFENFFRRKSAFSLDKLKTTIKAIIDDANKPHRGDRFATDFIDYPLSEELKSDFPKSSTFEDIFKEFFKEQYNKEQQAVNPPFVSGLSLALDKILPANLDKNGTVQASRLINQMRNAAGGDLGKFINEANAIGFTDWLKSKGQTRVSEAEIRQYIQEKGIQVHIDPRTDMAGNEWQGGGFDTSRYVAEGKTEGYHTFVVRINPKHAHGVEGHYGEDSIVHIRATDRVDAQGRKVLFVEEIQSINTAGEVLSEAQRKVTESDLVKLNKLKNELREIEIKTDKLLKENANRFNSGKKSEEDSDIFSISYDKINDDKDIKVTDIIRGYDNDFVKQYTEGKYTNSYDILMIISEKKSKLAKVKSNKPLQDMPETVKIASRAIMRKAVELGADRVVLVRPEDMHKAVSTNAEGERFVDALYGKEIPRMIDAELQKYGQKLKPARNFDKANKQFYSQESELTTKQFLSESLGYDITPEMKQKAGRSQTFMMPSEETSMPFNEFTVKTEKEAGTAWSTPFYKKLEGAVLTGSSIEGFRILGVSIDKNNQVKLNTISEEKYQSIIKKFPEGKTRDNAIRSASEDMNATDDRKGGFRHPLFYLKSDIENIKFDALSSKPVKKVSFNAQTIASVVNSITDDLSGVEFDKTSTTTLFGRKSKTGEVKGIIQNLQDAVQELNKARTTEEKIIAENRLNSHIEELRSLKDDLQDKHDNTPESFQETDSYTKREDAIDSLDDAITNIENTTEEGLSDSTRMMPSEGEYGGKYTESELKRKFIGKYAQENPDLADNIRLEFKEDYGYADEEAEIGYGRKIIQLKRMGEIVGQIKFNLEDDRFFKSNDETIRGKFVKDISVNVNPEYRGQGYQHLLYSEMFERARDLGAIAFRQEVENSQGLPLKSTNKIVGKDKSVIWTLTSPELLEPTQANFDKTMKNAPILGKKGAGLKGFSDVPSVSHFGELDPNARYMPSEGEQGGRTYSEEQFNKEFIGKYAQENPELKNQYIIRIKPHTDSDQGDGYKIVIYDKNTNKAVARSKWEIIEDYNNEGETYLKEAAADVQILDESYKGKKLSHLMQSERIERSRYLGAVKTMSQITNQEGIPIKNYAKTIGVDKGNIADFSIETDGEEPAKIPATIENFNRVMNDAKAKANANWKPTVFYEGEIDSSKHYMPSEQAQAWRDFKAEPTTEGNSIFKNAMNFVIIQANNKFKVYNPQKALLGIYNDLDGAKRRVQREEPKQQ